MDINNEPAAPAKGQTGFDSSQTSKHSIKPKIHNGSKINGVLSAPADPSNNRMARQPNLTDSEREALIRDHKTCMDDDKLSPNEKRQAWHRMRELINNRSDEQILKMEKEQKLNE